jgi:pyrroline-5-carboxylate reductase
MLPPSFETGGGPALVSVTADAPPAGREALEALVALLGAPAAWTDDPALDVLTVTVAAVAPYLAAFLGAWSDWAVAHAPALERGEVARMMVSSLSGVARQFEHDGGFDLTLRHAATPGGLAEAALSALRRDGVLDAVNVGPDTMRARAAELRRTILAEG